MPAFLSENIGTIVVLAIIIASVVLILVKMHRDKKKGKNLTCGCGCYNCPSAGMCHNTDKK